jgi:hypothetical protein
MDNLTDKNNTSTYVLVKSNGNCQNNMDCASGICSNSKCVVTDNCNLATRKN